MLLINVRYLKTKPYDEVLGAAQLSKHLKAFKSM